MEILKKDIVFDCISLYFAEGLLLLDRSRLLLLSLYHYHICSSSASIGFAIQHFKAAQLTCNTMWIGLITCSTWKVRWALYRYYYLQTTLTSFYLNRRLDGARETFTENVCKVQRPVCACIYCKAGGLQGAQQWIAILQYEFFFNTRKLTIFVAAW